VRWTLTVLGYYEFCNASQCCLSKIATMVCLSKLCNDSFFRTTQVQIAYVYTLPATTQHSRCPDGEQKYQTCCVTTNSVRYLIIECGLLLMTRKLQRITTKRYN